MQLAALLSGGEVELAEPGAGQVLIRARAASAHADVWQTVRGSPKVLRIVGGGQPD